MMSVSGAKWFLKILYCCSAAEIVLKGVLSKFHKLELYGARCSKMIKLNLWKTVFKKTEVIWSALADHTTSKILKDVFHKFYLLHSWISWSICKSFKNSEYHKWPDKRFGLIEAPIPNDYSVLKGKFLRSIQVRISSQVRFNA